MDESVKKYYRVLKEKNPLYEVYAYQKDPNGYIFYVRFPEGYIGNAQFLVTHDKQIIGINPISYDYPSTKINKIFFQKIIY